MNPPDQLAEALAERFPDATIELDPATTKTGGWFLDITLDGHDAVVEWRPEQGFGVSSNEDPPFGHGTDELYTDQRTAFERVVEILTKRLRTDDSSAR
jgi:hypothetical protein